MFVVAPPTRIPRDPDRIRYERCLSGSVADRVSSPRCTLESERSSLVSVSLSDEQLNREKSKKRQTPTSAICDSGTPTQGFEVPSEVSAIPGPWAYKKLRAAAILETHGAAAGALCAPPAPPAPHLPSHPSLDLLECAWTPAVEGGFKGIDLLCFLSVCAGAAFGHGSCSSARPP